MNKEESQVASELSVLEHNLQHLLMQRQAIESQLNELSSAILEVSKSTGEIYHVVGPVMLKTQKEDALKELESRKKLLDSRLLSIDKQEKLLDFKAKELQKEIRNSSKQ